MNLSEIDSPKGPIKCTYNVTSISKTRYFTSSDSIVTSRRMEKVVTNKHLSLAVETEEER